MSKRPLVAILDPQFEGEEYKLDIEGKVLNDVADVECFNALKIEDIPDKVSEPVAILCWHHLTNIGKETIERMKNCKLIVRIGMGFDNVDIKAAGELGIKVCNIPDYGVEEVADSAISLMLNIMRRTHWSANLTKKGEWGTSALKGATRLHGSKVGIVGLGKIGTAFALRAKAFSMDVQFYDPYVPYGMDKALGITRVGSLKELVSTSDVISLHCPLTMENVDNHHLINSEILSHFKKGAVLINTSRGPVIDEEALCKSLQDGTVSAAGLDVFEKEPYKDGSLLKLDNVILTPHGAFYSDQSVEEMRSKAALEAKRIIEGQDPWYCVNEKYVKNSRSAK